MPKRYELEFDMWRKCGNFQMLPMRVRVAATSRAYAEKRMRDTIYKYGGYNGRYVAFYPNGTTKVGRVVKPPEDVFKMQMHSAITSHQFHYGFGKKDFKK